MTRREVVGRERPEIALVLAAVALAVLFAAAVAADVGVAVVSAIAGRGWTLAPASELGRLGAALLRHPGNLASAYPAEDRGGLASNTALWCGITVVWVLGLASLVLLGALVVPLLRHTPGFETPLSANRVLGGAAVRTSTARLHPGLAAGRGNKGPVGGPRLGRIRHTGIGLHASLEDSVLVLGPTGSGKSAGVMYRAVADAVGSVVSTSTKPEVLLHTAALRRSDGRRVWVFDPQGISGWPDVLRWSPVRGCADPAVAMVRAAGMAEASRIGTGVTNGDFWSGQTAAVLRCYLHAAALADLTALDVLRWTRNPKAEEPVAILAEHPAAAGGWGDELAEQKSAPANQVGSVWAGVRRAVDALADPRIAATCSPSRGEEFNPAGFIASGESLYVMGSNKATLSVAPLIVALVEDLVDVGRRTAAVSAGERMPLPMTLALDEVANIAPLPSLPYVLGDGRGQGFQVIAVFQSLAQARSRWGEAEAEVIWDTATCRMILPGLANQRDTAMISSLLGDYDEISHRRSSGRGGSTVNEDVRSRPAVPAHAVRELKPGTFLLIHRHLRPVLGQLEMSYRGRDAARFAAAAAEGRRITGRAVGDTR